ncbi:YqeG family HAD IIIA-type phosphatase [Clostridia bacterium]|nr:YqeG family HAD IIIA-type phosphatase [Clostridia bacterium]
MLKRLTPDLYVKRIYNIPFSYLEKNKIKGVVIDLDNTIAPWNSNVIEKPFSDWLNMVQANGIQIVLVSNNKEERVKVFSKLIDVPFIAGATKPLRTAFIRAMDMMGSKKNETVVIGDQIFTDILGGNMVGLHTILVEPMASKEFIGTKVLRALERLVLSHLSMTEEKYEE